MFDEAQIAELKRDWRSFSELRRSVRIRYQEAVDVTEFEPKIKRLLDDHVAAMPGADHEAILTADLGGEAPSGAVTCLGAAPLLQAAATP